MRHRGRRIAFALIAVLVLGLSACSGDEPSPLATSTTSPSPSLQLAETSTPEVTATKPALLLGQPTEDSAAAFVKYFWEAHNYAYATYDTSLLQAISQPTCKYCQSIIEDVDQRKKSDSKIVGLQAFIVDTAFPSNEPITDQTFLVALTSQRPGTITTPDGKVTKIDGSKNSQLGFGLDWNGGRWLVRGVEIQKQGTKWPG